MTHVTPTRFFSPSEVAQIIGVSVDTIRRQIRSHRLIAVKMPPGYHYKVTAAEVLRYADNYDIPLFESNRRLLEEMLAEETGEISAP